MKNSEIIVKGNGTQINNIKAMRGRAKKKMITQILMLNLISIAEKKGNKKLAQSFWRTWRCQNRVYSSGGKLYGKYCKNRFCFVCSGIRKARIINKYLPIIKEWDNPYFVTLTVKSVPAHRLNLVVDKVIEGFQQIVNKYEKRNKRGKDIKLIGVKSIESNFNPAKKTYNPHLHLIVPNEEIADIFINEWLSLWGKKWTNKAAQDKRKITDPVKCLIEIVKYFSKVFTEPDPNRKSKKNNKPKKIIIHTIYVRAMYNIIGAMKDHRIFGSFGFKSPVTPKINGGKSTTLNQFDEWRFNRKQTDWLNNSTGEKLTGYLPFDELTALLNNNINIDLE